MCLWVDACQFRFEHIRVFRALHIIGIIRERPVFQQRLRAQFDTVHEEDHLSASFEPAMSCAALKLVMVLPEPVVCHT